MEKAVGTKRRRLQKEMSALIISAMMLALCLVIKFITQLIPFMNLPYGGSISIILVPLVLTSLYCGPLWGLIISISYSVINFLLDGVSTWTPNTNAVILTLFLDYIIAFGVCALAAVFRKAFYEKKNYAAFVSVLLVGVLRFLSHFFSGVIVWNNIWDYEGAIKMDWSKAGVIYSLTYNGSYMLPSIILSCLLIAFLLPAIQSTFKLPVVKNLYAFTSESDESKTLSFKKLAPLFSLVLLVIAVLSMIPSLKCNWLGYFSLACVVFFLGYDIYKLIRERKSGVDIIDIYGVFLDFVILLMSIIGAISMYTYGHLYY